MCALFTWKRFFLRVGFTHLLLNLLQVGVSTPIVAQILSDDEIIKTYFLTQPINTIADVEKSFKIKNYNNVIAINWLKTIDKSTNEKDLAEILPLIRSDLILPSTIPQPLGQIYMNAEENISIRLSQKANLEKKKLEVAYLCSYFIHYYYLFQAKNGSLILNPAYGKSIYTNFADGKIPKEFQDDNTRIVFEDSVNEGIHEDGTNVLTKFIKVLPFGYYGLIPVLLLVISFLIRNTSPAIVVKQKEKIDLDHDIDTSNLINATNTDINLIKKGHSEKPDEELMPNTIIEWTVTENNMAEKGPKSREINEFVETKKVEKKLLYARFPYGNIFHQVEEFPIPFLTQFQLLLNPLNENEAFFTFIENDSSLRDLIQSNLRIFDEICEIISEQPISSPSDIQTLVPGKAIKEGEYWRVVTKIVLR